MGGVSLEFPPSTSLTKQTANRADRRVPSRITCRLLLRPISTQLSTCRTPFRRSCKEGHTHEGKACECLHFGYCPHEADKSHRSPSHAPDMVIKATVEQLRLLSSGHFFQRAFRERGMLSQPPWLVRAASFSPHVRCCSLTCSLPSRFSIIQRTFSGISTIFNSVA